MTLYGYARVSVREPEDKNLDLQVERLVRSGCAMANIRAEEASGAKDERGGLLELLDLVVDAIRMSQSAARSIPAPMANPLTAAMNGLGLRPKSWLPRYASIRSSSVCSARVLPPSSAISRRSAPAENARPAPPATPPASAHPARSDNLDGPG